MSLNFIKDLNPQQRKAVLYNNGPLLILAGAGSGKTKALTYKAGFLILKKQVEPEKILMVTFTNKAAGEMKQRIKNILSKNQTANSSQKPPLASTFHSFCAKILRADGQNIGIPPSFLIYDKTDQLDLIKQTMKLLNISIKQFKPGSIARLISSAKNQLLSPLEYLNYAKGYFQKTAAQVYLQYQKLLANYEALDFDDLIFKTVSLFQKNSSILEKYHNRFIYIMVDEYHDTNHAQYQLTKLLALKSQKITVVADCSQSIYGWRGADFKNVLNLKNDFPNLKTINLEQNYRSTKTILKAAFNVIKQNTSHPVLKLWTNNLAGEKIKIYQAKNEKDEASFVAKKIQSLAINAKQKAGNHHSFFNNFAVLYRTNAQSRALEETFLHYSLPYILVGGTRFYERKEIKDCLAYLRLLANPKDRVSYQRVEKLGKKRLNQFLNLAEKIKIKKNSTAKILKQVLKTTNYLNLFNKKNEKDLARLENIKELFSVASEFPNLADFLENVSLVEQENFFSNQAFKRKGRQKNAITLMTMHAAKGLEFQTVFMVGMEEGLFPHSQSLLEKEKLEEERRLAYVGITRAKKNLYLLFSQRRLYFGAHNFNQVSRFVAEIPSNLLEFINYDYSRSLSR